MDSCWFDFAMVLVFQGMINGALFRLFMDVMATYEHYNYIK